MGYALRTEVDQPFADTLDATRAALGEQGFGVLTEIDLQATLKAKLDADIDPQVILGAEGVTHGGLLCRLGPAGVKRSSPGRRPGRGPGAHTGLVTTGSSDLTRIPPWVLPLATT